MSRPIECLQHIANAWVQTAPGHNSQGTIEYIRDELQKAIDIVKELHPEVVRPADTTTTINQENAAVVALDMQIVQLREMVKARDEEIANLKRRDSEWIKRDRMLTDGVAKRDEELCNIRSSIDEIQAIGKRCGVKEGQAYTSAISARLDELEKMLANAKGQIHDMMTNVWAWRQLSPSQQAEKLKQEIEELRNELRSEKDYTADQSRALDNRNEQITNLKAELKKATEERYEHSCRLDAIGRVLRDPDIVRKG